MSDEYQSEKFGVEPFGTLEGVLAGAPIKLMPVGKFYRDERILDITESDLKEIERNVAAGLPRFRIPINENHQPGGKIGTVKSVKYMPNGPDGKGLYADAYELTDIGKQLLKDGRYDAISPELIWSKNGASYVDPQSGRKYDNILAGIAICEKPFFSHEHVALFSADPPRRHNGYTKLREMMKAKFDELMAMVKDEDGDGVPDAEQASEGTLGTQVFSTFTASTITSGNMQKLPDGTYDWKTATPPDAGVAAEIPAADAAIIQGVETMAEVEKPTPPATEQMKAGVSAEEFAAYQKRMDAELLAARTETATLRQARRLDALTARYDAFIAVPVKAADLAEKFMALEMHDPKLFEFFDGLVAQLDSLAAQADLFGQKADSRARPETRGESFEALTARLLVEKFDGDISKQSDANALAGKQRPDLLRAYLHGAPESKE